MDRFRRLLCTAVMLALLTSLAATPVMAKNRTITGRGIEQPGEGPGLDVTGDPEPGGGGLPRMWADSKQTIYLMELLLRTNLELLSIELGIGSTHAVREGAAARGQRK